MNQEKSSSGQIPTASSANHKGYNKVKRVVVSALCVLTSSIGILSSFTMIITSFATLFIGTLGATGIFLALASACFLFVWISYFVMMWGWIRNEEVAPTWPIFGTLAGVGSALVMNVLSLSVLPSIILAVYLVRFHLGNGPRR